MIDDYLTFLKFGYYPNNLTATKSHKKVVCICENCGNTRETDYLYANRLCKQCGYYTVAHKISISKKTKQWHTSGEFKRGCTPLNGFKSGHTIWLGRKHTDSSKSKMKANHRDMHCEASPWWNGGTTDLITSIRQGGKQRLWRKDVFSRDNFTCQHCYKSNCYLEAHHIIKFSIILKNFLSLYPTLCPISNKTELVALSNSYTPFWDISNGICLCLECHTKTRVSN